MPSGLAEVIEFAVVSSAFTLLTKDAPKVWRKIVSATRADHQAISRPWFRNDQGGRSAIYLNIAVGPSRSISARLPDYDRAHTWLNRIFPNLFPYENGKHFPRETIRFPELPEGTPHDCGQVNVWPNGGFEAAIRLTAHETPEGIYLSVPEIAGHIVRLVDAIRRGSYHSIYGYGWRPRKLDWFVSISATYIKLGEVNRTEWRGLLFSGAQPSCPHPAAGVPIAAQGLATRSILNLSRRTKPEKLARLVIADLCASLGYVDYLSAVCESIEARQTSIA